MPSGQHHERQRGRRIVLDRGVVGAIVGAHGGQGSALSVWPRCLMWTISRLMSCGLMSVSEARSGHDARRGCAPSISDRWRVLSNALVTWLCCLSQPLDTVGSLASRLTVDPDGTGHGMFFLCPVLVPFMRSMEPESGALSTFVSWCESRLGPVSHASCSTVLRQPRMLG